MPVVPRRLRLPPALLALVLAAGTLVWAPSPADAAPFRLNLYRSGDFVGQTNLVQCVGASMQMMINMMAGRDDRTAVFQLRLQDVARSLSNAPGNPIRERRGASVRGWSAGLNDLGFGPYRVAGFDTIDEAMSAAARAIRATDRPVGLLVWRGRHAWVMSGFEASADPLVTSRYRVTHAFVLDPLYPGRSPIWGASPRPGSRLAVGTLGEDFVKRTSRRSSWLSGKWVLVLPVERFDVFSTIEMRRD